MMGFLSSQAFGVGGQSYSNFLASTVIIRPNNLVGPKAQKDTPLDVDSPNSLSNHLHLPHYGIFFVYI